LEAIVRIPGVRRAELLDTVNRFVVVLRDRNGDRFLCHLPDTGRLARIMPSGTPAYYVEVPRAGRFTGCDVVALKDGDVLVLVDSRLPNIVFHRLIPRIFGEVDVSRYVAREVQVRSPFLWYRADFMILGYGEEPLVVEVKGVNYAIEGIGLFPSARSDRASAQLDALRFLRIWGGARAMIAFIALRSDIEVVKPNADVDPKFARRLCSYKDTIEYRAYKVRGELKGPSIHVYYEGEIPVEPCHNT